MNILHSVFYAFVTVKGKTDGSGKLFKRLKCMDDEWLKNSP